MGAQEVFDAINDGSAASLPLLAWLSPTFPVGAFAYSHGLEAAVEAADIVDADTLREWLRDLLRHGAGRNDCILLAAAWRAAKAGEFADLAELNALALALAPSRERLLETRAQGDAFVAAINAAWPCEEMTEFAARETAGAAYPIALGIAAAGHGVPLESTTRAFLLGFVSNLVSVAVRLGPIGQTDGQKIIAASMRDVAAIASAARVATPADLGGASMRSDIASMRHEVQYSRLFRS